ncbi:hypothetical protein D3C71_2051870 [compost metagenome]
MDSGEILADGPELTLPLSAVSSDGTPLAEWLERLEDFLASIEEVVKERFAAM